MPPTDADLVIIANGTIAGRITRLDRNRLRLTYDDAYAASSDATPLSVTLPVAETSHTDTAARPVVTNFLWGLLPDDDKVRTQIATTFGVRSTSPFFLLGSPIGEDTAGAFTFVPEPGVDKHLARGGHVEWLDDQTVAALLREVQARGVVTLGPENAGRFSLAGMQRKIALRQEKDQWGRPSGTAATTHILKPAAVMDGQDLNEHLCLAAAHAVGVRAATTTIRTFAGETALVVERYDREWIDGSLNRIHQEDLCQAMGLPPTMKYQIDGGPSPKEIVELFRATMRFEDAEPSTRRFAEALALNWIIVGTDAHAKNYSLLHRGGRAELAPLYDVSSWLPYHEPGRERHVKMAMTLGGEADIFPVLDHWNRAGSQLRLPAGAMRARAIELCKTLPDAIADAAHDPMITAFDSSVVAALVDGIAVQARRCLVAMAGR